MMIKNILDDFQKQVQFILVSFALYALANLTFLFSPNFNNPLTSDIKKEVHLTHLHILAVFTREEALTGL